MPSIFSPTGFRQLVSGERRGPYAISLRMLLRCAELFYATIMRLRNGAYNLGCKKTHTCNARVISVGNLTLGGTGKSPFVAWLSQVLAELEPEKRQVLISRGYKSLDGEENDEARELARKLPGVQHLLNSDRVAAAEEAISQLGGELLLLDDAFQHRRMARDLDIVLLDALEPFGFSHVFPRGTLREPASGLHRADVVVLTRSDLLNATETASLREKVHHLAPNALFATATHAPVSLLRGAETPPLSELTGKRCFAFCGIGNPAGFRATLQQAGADLVGFREFDDHHHYTPADLTALTEAARESQADLLLCTEKDLVKIDNVEKVEPSLYAVAIAIQLTSGKAELRTQLQKVLAIGPRKDTSPR